MAMPVRTCCSKARRTRDLKPPWSTLGSGAFFAVFARILPVTGCFFFLLVILSHARGLIGPACLEAIPAINGLAAIGFKRHLRVYITPGANRVIHLALRAIVASASVSPTVIPAAAAAIAATATLRLGRIPARLTFARRLEAFGFVKLLLFLAKRKICATSGTCDIGCHYIGTSKVLL